MSDTVNPWPDFAALCELGGRLCGTPAESAARAMLTKRLGGLAARCGGRFEAIPLAYDGWRARSCALRLSGGQQTFERIFDGYPLLHSPATGGAGLTAEIVDLGRGARADFEAHEARVPGRIVLVRHEFMFSGDHVHRARKYGWAEEFGAAAFLIAGTGDQHGPVAGGIGFGDPPTIPAAGISAEAAAAAATGGGEAVLTIETDIGPADTETLILDLPGETDEWVVVSAHLDGHGIGQSAMDNATGVAAALAATESLAASDVPRRRGVRLCLFSIEEWGLLASRAYVDGLDDDARRAIVLNVNLDSVAGADGLAALYSGFAPLGDFLRDVSEAAGIPLALHEPLVRNSDHYNFAVAGIPAFRLMTGFEKPKSNMRHVLTAGDTIDKVRPDELRLAAELTLQVVLRAASAASLDLRSPAGGPAR